MPMSFREEILPQWHGLFAQLFPLAMPNHVEWRDITEMVSVLNHVGSIRNVNHLFFPTGGGLDLSGANQSYEADCLELDFEGIIKIVKPNLLSCEIMPNSEWSYFRLETSPLSPSGVYDSPSSDSDEEVLEVRPGTYEDRSYWEQGNLGFDSEGDEIALPTGARVLARCIPGGAFAIFCKASIYNQVSQTYDARHNKMNSRDFRDYIFRSARANPSS